MLSSYEHMWTHLYNNSCFVHSISMSTLPKDASLRYCGCLKISFDADMPCKLETKYCREHTIGFLTNCFSGVPTQTVMIAQMCPHKSTVLLSCDKGTIPSRLWRNKSKCMDSGTQIFNEHRPFIQHVKSCLGCPALCKIWYTSFTWASGIHGIESLSLNLNYKHYVVCTVYAVFEGFNSPFHTSCDKIYIILGTYLEYVYDCCACNKSDKCRISL